MRKIFSGVLLIIILFSSISVSAFDISKDYSELMAECVVNSNENMGEWYAHLRNKKINKYGGFKFSYEDLNLLSKIIEAESGMLWLSDYIRMCVGEVVLNRVSSVEFPDTIAEVVYQEGQYHHAEYGLLKDVIPTEKCVRVALRLLNGEKVINNVTVVFQSNYILGSGVYEIITDEFLGNTYLCYSNNIELYH